MSARQAARRRRLVSLAGIAAVAALFMLLAFFVGKPLIRSFRESPEAFRAYVDGHRLLGTLIMLGITMLQVIVAFIPGEPFELGAGFAFGWFWGAQQGAPFLIEAHRAWLAVPKSAGARAYLIDGEATGIGAVPANEAGGQLYDLQGRRIDTPTAPGVYLLNRRKVVVK